MSYIGNEPTSVAFLTDSFSGTGSQTAFTLSAAPANTSSILVAVSGVLQDPTTYSTTGTTLTFSAAPPAGTSNISVRFLGIPASGVTTTAYRTQTEFTATAGQTTFSVPSYTVGFIDVYRNGALLGSADFTATSGTTVVLNNAASEGDLVETVSFFVSSVINAIPAVAGAVTSSYLLNGSVTQAKLGVGVAGNGPSFGASQTTPQTITADTFTKLQYNVEDWDTASCYDNTTNFRFTPNVAGFYQVNARTQFIADAAARQETFIAIYRTGGEYKRLPGSGTPATAISNPGGSVLVYLNGSTDYIEAYIYYSQGSATTAINASAVLNYFQASLVRAA
jgi:hypothetical protein